VPGSETRRKQTLVFFYVNKRKKSLVWDMLVSRVELGLDLWRRVCLLSVGSEVGQRGMNSAKKTRFKKRYYCRGGLFGSKCDLPRRLNSVPTVAPFWENGTIPLLTLTLTTITSMQLQNKHTSRVQTTSRPHHHATPKQNYCM
jgi:hypothetical protein